MSRAPIFLEVKGGRISPADSYAMEQLSNLPDGKYNARFSKQTRAGREEREGARGLWWAGCKLLSDNVESPLWDTPRKAHEMILKGLGFVRPRFRVDGSFDMVVVSTSESEMDDDEFLLLMEKARAYVTGAHGFDPWAMWVEQQEGRKWNASEAIRT